MPARARSSSSSTEVAVSDSTIHAQIVGYAANKRDAAKFTAFLSHISKHLDQDPKLKDALGKMWSATGVLWKDAKDAHDFTDGIKKALTASRYKGIDNALIRGTYGASGVAGALGVLVDRFRPIAAHHHIPLNEVSICLAKVCLDIGAAGTASAVATVTVAFAATVAASTAVEAFLALLPLILLAVAIMETFKDGLELGRAFLAG